MLASPGSGVRELQAELGIPEEEVRSALDTLSELVLVIPSREGSAGLRAISPDLGMEMLLSRQQAELAEQQRQLEMSRATAAQLIAEYADLRPRTVSPGVEQLVGLDQVRERLISLTREVATEVMTLASGAHTQQGIDAARPLDQELLDRGLVIRTVYLDSVRNSLPTMRYVDWLTAQGAQVRTLPMLPTRMIIVDRARAVIPVNSDDTAAGAVLLSGHGTLTALCALFESLWEQAQPLGLPPVPDVDGLTPQARTALALLAEGHTDEAIAKRLAVSPRTARRIATELIERLGARSRFQAGVRAVELGWLVRRRS